MSYEDAYLKARQEIEDETRGDDWMHRMSQAPLPESGKEREGGRGPSDKEREKTEEETTPEEKARKEEARIRKWIEITKRMEENIKSLLDNRLIDPAIPASEVPGALRRYATNLEKRLDKNEGPPEQK